MHNEAKVFLAPLQIGTGLQNKLLEAMSMEVPCITSQLANNALMAEHQKDILIGNTPDEYVKAVCDLLDDSSLYNSISKNGKDFVTANYNWNAITRKLEQDFFG